MTLRRYAYKWCNIKEYVLSSEPYSAEMHATETVCQGIVVSNKLAEEEVSPATTQASWQVVALYSCPRPHVEHACFKP